MRNRRFERRDVLKAGGVAVGSLFAAQTLAGSLEPPAGPPSPGGRSLQEIEPRTPVNSLPSGGGAVHLISSGGSYKLTGNINLPPGSVGIRVATTEPVSIDLNGFAIQGGGSGQGGVVCDSTAPGCPYLEIFDGYILGIGGGIGIDGGTARVLECNDLHIDFCGQRGIIGRGSLTVEGCVIQRCTYEGIVWEKSTTEPVVFIVDDCEITSCAAGIVVGGDWTAGTGTASITQTDVVGSSGPGVWINLTSPQGNPGGRLSAALQDVRVSQCSVGVTWNAFPSPGGTGASLTVQCEDVVCTNNHDGMQGFSATVDLIDCACVDNASHGFSLSAVQGSVDNCIASRNTGDGILLTGACRMSVSENAAQANGGAGIHIGAGAASTHVADNDVRDQAIGIQDEGTNTLMVRNSATGNGNNYALGSTPAVIVTAAQLTTNTNPHANYSLP